MTCEGCGVTIARRSKFGVPPKWCSDKCRKRTLYSGVCVDCGGRTDGIASGKTPVIRCSPCTRSGRHREAVARILSAIRRWADENGGVPPRGPWTGTRPWLVRSVILTLLRVTSAVRGLRWRLSSACSGRGTRDSSRQGSCRSRQAPMVASGRTWSTAARCGLVTRLASRLACLPPTTAARSPSEAQTNRGAA